MRYFAINFLLFFLFTHISLTPRPNTHVCARACANPKRRSASKHQTNKQTANDKSNVKSFPSIDLFHLINSSSISYAINLAHTMSILTRRIFARSLPQFHQSSIPRAVYSSDSSEVSKDSTLPYPDPKDVPKVYLQIQI